MQDTERIVLSRFTMEVITSCLTMAIGAIVTYGSLEFGTAWGDAGPEPGYFPFHVGLIVCLASLGVLVQAFVVHRKTRTAFVTRKQATRILAFFGPMLAFVVLSTVVGFYVGLMLYLIGVMALQGGYRLYKALIVAVGAAVFFYLIFEVWFQVPLLKGPVEAWLGIH